MVTGRFEEAEKLLNGALIRVSDPQYDTVRMHLYLSLVQVYWATGRNGEATACSELVVGICQNSVQPLHRTYGHFVLGHDYLANSKYAQAEKAFRIAIF